MPPTPICIIAGIGPGTGAALARRFAKNYPVALLARKETSYEPLAKEINESGGKAAGFSADVADAKSMKSAFEGIKQQFGGQGELSCAAAIFNASGPFSRKPFLELSSDGDEFMASFEVGVRGAFLFSQACLPMLLQATSNSPQHPPTIIYTGATASVKSSAMLSPFSCQKYALRALTQSLGKEFGPRGVHVAHAIIDGIIDIPATAGWMKDAGPDAKISPEEIANAYWYLHTQPRSAFSNEIDIRPFCEKW